MAERVAPQPLTDTNGAGTMRYSHEAFLKELGARLKRMRQERGWTLRDMVIEHRFHITHWQKF